MSLQDKPDVELVTAELIAGPDDTVISSLIVYTRLVLNVTEPGHDKPRVDALLEAAMQHRIDNPHVQSVVVRQMH